MGDSLDAHADVVADECGRGLQAEVRAPERPGGGEADGLALRFFHFYPSQLKQFQRAAEEGLCLRAFGEVRKGFFGAEMAHPRYRLVRGDEPLPDALTPIYPTTAGLPQGTLRSLIRSAGLTVSEFLSARKGL